MITKGIRGAITVDGNTENDIKKRLEVIPDDVLQLWRNGYSGPWDYFRGRDLKYCHIAIDEV